MNRMPSLVDMSLTAEDRKEDYPMVLAGTDSHNGPKYPYGLSISLTQHELEKLNVDYSDWNVGDHFHLICMAKITSISENETEKGKNCRVELQITALSGENEELESEEENEGERLRSS